ncbi:MAG TPA: SDR family oxidoreductase [Bacteroidia bacterium]|jgi:3-oxoacyl-[acyl-carrier protein] reductase|nr:SDR family oxidoreductase [Bacteroidia bacterium]
MKILITGGASGLGAAISEKLAQHKDSNIIITYSESVQKARRLESFYKNIKAIKCNFSDKNDVITLMELIQKEQIDVLINNAHTTKIDKNYFHKLSTEAFTYGFNQNILPVIQITQVAINIFRKKKYGKIITILSASLINKPPFGFSEYTASKAYLLSLSKSWANENATFNITSNCVSPSFMQTGLTEDTDERIMEEMLNKHPLKRLLGAGEVAEVVAFLCDSTQQINGINISINSAENVV